MRFGGRWAIKFGVQEAICKIFLFVETVSTFVISIIVRSLLSFRCQHKMSPLPIYEVPHKSTHWLMAHEKPTNPKYVNSPTYKLKNSSTHRFTSSSTHDYINSQANSSQAHQLTNLSTHKLIHSRVHPFISSATHELSNPQKIKFLSLSLQYRSNFRSILAKI